MRLASKKQHARPHGKGLTFIKRETKTRLWAFSLHDLNEQTIVIKCIKMFFFLFLLFVLLFKSWFTHSDCKADLFPKKIYGDAKDYFNLSGFQPVLTFSFFFGKIIA